MKFSKLWLVLALSSPILAAEPAPGDAKAKSGKYLIEETSGYGGSVLLLYGNGGALADTLSAGLRGFLVIGNNFRTGAISNMTWKTNNSSSNREMAGSLGLFGEYLLRFDPLIVGLGLKAAGGWYMSHDRNSNMSGTSYAYFNAMPFAEVELRLTEHISTGFFGGYDYFAGNSAAPSISQAVVGLMVTVAKF